MFAADDCMRKINNCRSPFIPAQKREHNPRLDVYNPHGIRRRLEFGVCVVRRLGAVLVNLLFDNLLWSNVERLKIVKSLPEEEIEYAETVGRKP